MLDLSPSSSPNYTSDITAISILYFDTTGKALSINLLEESGCLFMAGDCCNHFCYRLKSLGNDELDEGEEIT